MGRTVVRLYYQSAIQSFVLGLCLFNVLVLRAQELEDDVAQVEAKIVLTEAEGLGEDRLHLATLWWLTGYSDAPELQVYVPEELLNEFGTLGENDEKQDWLYRHFQDQFARGDAASGEALGVFLLYGWGGEFNMPRARELLLAAIERGSYEGARFYTEIQMMSSEQPLASRDALGLIKPLLNNQYYWVYWSANEAILNLESSSLAEDQKHARALVDLATTVLIEGFQNLPEDEDEQRGLVEFADSFVAQHFDEKDPESFKRNESIVAAWREALPENGFGKVRELSLLILREKWSSAVDLAGELSDSGEIGEENQYWAREVLIDLLTDANRGQKDWEQAERLLKGWLESEPESKKAQFLFLHFHQARKDWKKLFRLATDLLGKGGFSESEIDDLRFYRLAAVSQIGNYQDLEEEDWDHLFEQYLKALKMPHLDPREFRKVFTISAVTVLGIGGLLWLAGTAFLTRFVFTKRGGFWVLALWAIPQIFGGVVVLFPWWGSLAFSLLAIPILLFAFSGGRTAVEYLMQPYRPDRSRRKIWLQVLVFVLACYVGFMAFSIFYDWIYQVVLSREIPNQFVAGVLQQNTLTGLLGAILVGGVFVPMLEEFVFRGLFVDWVGRLLPVVPTVLIVSVVFGLLHGLNHALPITVLGILLSYLRLRFRSLWPPILLHSFNNTMICIFLYLDPDSLWR